MLGGPANTFNVAGDYQPLIRQIGLDAQAVFEDPRIVVWRKLPDRENCTLDEDLPDGRHVRFHIKRYAGKDARAEVCGHELLQRAAIPTAPLVGWGGVIDGRSFTIFDDLTGYKPADKLLDAGTAFDLLLEPVAALAARLHNARLHHRDLYLCHFMARVIGDKPDLKLIDVARVRRLPGLLPRRWIVKDLAQFWYSTLKHTITDDQRIEWLRQYANACGIDDTRMLQRATERKARSIARHDARLHRKRPERDVSIPTGQP